MQGKRYSEEPIISVLKEYKAGIPTQNLLRKHGITNGMFIAGKRSTMDGGIGSKAVTGTRVGNNG